jgi:glutathione S-transferase
MLTLYHNDMSTCSQRVRFVLAAKDLEWTGVELNLREGDQHKPEFLRLNPKGVVPVLVDDDSVVNESTIIMEYLEETRPQAPLMPATALERARVRAWMQRLDSGLHLHVATLSFAIAFRLQLLNVLDTDDKLEGFYAKIPDPEYAAFYRDIVPLGVDSSRFPFAVLAYDRLLSDMEVALTQHQWLVGDRLSLADAAYAPYLTRLDHLSLQALWSSRAAVGDWYVRIRETPGYLRGISDWFNPKFLQLMGEAGAAVDGRVAEILNSR